MVFELFFNCVTVQPKNIPVAISGSPYWCTTDVHQHGVFTLGSVNFWETFTTNIWSLARRTGRQLGKLSYFFSFFHWLVGFRFIIFLLCDSENDLHHFEEQNGNCRIFFCKINDKTCFFSSLFFIYVLTFLWYKSMPFPIFWSGSFAVQYGDHFRSGIICGSIWRSFPVRDHLRSWDHLRSRTVLFFVFSNDMSSFKVFISSFL